jgi:hypothetical protein
MRDADCLNLRCYHRQYTQAERRDAVLALVPMLRVAHCGAR